MIVREDGIVEVPQEIYDVLNSAYNVIGMIAVAVHESGSEDDKAADILNTCGNIISLMDNLDTSIAIEGYGIA